MIGVDVGAAEVSRSDGRRFGHRSAATPGDLLRRVAEEVPFVVADRDGCAIRPAQETYAAAVAEAIPADHETSPGENAPTVGLAVPGWWTPRALACVRAALAEEDLDVLLVNDAEAAIAGHRADGHEVPQTVAVVSVRAEHASVVIVQEAPGRPIAVASPALVHHSGGARLDVAVLRHLVRGLSDLGDRIDQGDPQTIAAARHALGRCREVREALSSTVVETVRLDLPGADHAIRLVRNEVEELAAPWADAVVALTGTALEHYAQPVDAVLLVGGLATMPLISQRLSADLATEVLVADDPQFLVARGARHVAARGWAAQQPVPPARPPRRSTRGSRADRVTRTDRRTMPRWVRARFGRATDERDAARPEQPDPIRVSRSAHEDESPTASLADVAPDLFADEIRENGHATEATEGQLIRR